MHYQTLLFKRQLKTRRQKRFAQYLSLLLTELEWSPGFLNLSPGLFVCIDCDTRVRGPRIFSCISVQEIEEIRNFHAHLLLVQMKGLTIL